MKLPSLALSGSASEVFRFTCSRTRVSGIGEMGLVSLEQETRSKSEMNWCFIALIFNLLKLSRVSFNRACEDTR